VVGLCLELGIVSQKKTGIWLSFDRRKLIYQWLEILDVLRGTTSDNVLKKKERKERKKEKTPLSKPSFSLYTHFS
jgi:hypothetical protein